VNFSILYLAFFISAGLTAAIALPWWRKWCLRTRLVDDPGHRKIHAQPVPLAGGLAVMTGLILPVLLGLLALWAAKEGSISGFDPEIIERLNHGLRKRAAQLAAIFIGALGMLAVGLLDDKYELKPLTKFSGQFAVAALVAAAGLRITLFVPSLLFSYTVTILWILAVINAFNFTDNMNGLCGGVGAISAFYIALLSAFTGQYLVALTAFVTCGALVGFLPYNVPRARAVLGDGGSHLVGYLLAVLAILPHFYTANDPRVFAVFSPLLILAVPLGDMLWVVLLRTRLGKPFYIGDNNHLSHRLVRAGLSRTRAVLVIWLLAAAIGAIVFI
jgi:UDP-GlcNAc:undecaprenyl-phosphate/decaprenyl-phosphate GlcNAc-1-phosphate transferase